MILQVFYFKLHPLFGKVPEWLNGTVSKTVYRLVRYEGSNPSLSAETKTPSNC